MILGIGQDIVEIARIEKLLARHPEKFVNRVFTAYERQTAQSSPHPVASYAKRFAAKEACAKALGTGMAGISWQDIEVRNTTSGQPFLVLFKRAQQALQALAPPHTQAQLHLSLSDSRQLAQAFVIISAISSQPFTERGLEC